MPIETSQNLLLMLILLLIELVLFGGVFKDIMLRLDSGKETHYLGLLGGSAKISECSRKQLAYAASILNIYHYTYKVSGLRVSGAGEAVPIGFIKNNAVSPVMSSDTIEYSFTSEEGPKANELMLIGFFNKNDACNNFRPLPESEFLKKCAGHLVGYVQLNVIGDGSCTDEGFAYESCDDINDVPVEYRGIVCLRKDGCYYDYFQNKCKGCDLPDASCWDIDEREKCACGDCFVIAGSAEYTAYYGSYYIDNGYVCMPCSNEPSLTCEQLTALDCLRKSCNRDCYWTESASGRYATGNCHTCPANPEEFDCENIKDWHLCKLGACGVSCEWENLGCIEA